MVSKFDIQKDHSELDAIDVEGNAAQFVEDDPMVRRKERTGKSSGYLTKRYRAWILGLVIVALFQLISIIILLATVFGAKSDDSNSYLMVTANYQLSSSDAVGKGVSIGSDGLVQVGAGTSVYYDRVPSLDDRCPKYLSMTGIHSGYYLVSYGNSYSNNATLSLLAVDDDEMHEGRELSQLHTPYALYEVELMSLSSGLFVAIAQDMTPNAQTAYVILGRADIHTGHVEIFENSRIAYTDQYSLDPDLTVLNETTFAIAFYSGDFVSVLTQYGVVSKAAEGSYSIHLSETVVFSSNANYDVTMSLAPISASEYLIVYSKSDADTTSGKVLLHARVAKLALSNVTLSSEVVYTTTEVKANILSLARIDAQTFVVAYVNIEEGGLVSQIIKYYPQGLKQFDATWQVYYDYIVFGGEWRIASGALANNFATSLVDVDIIASANRHFAVLYSDVSNNNAITVRSGRVTNSGNIESAHTDFILESTYDINSKRAWGALAVGYNNSFEDDFVQVGILSVIAESDCNVESQTTFSVMESKAAPLGVVTSSGLNTVQVAISGDIHVDTAQMTPSRTYYATTTGQIVSGTQPIGSNYVYNADHKIYVSLDSQVGIAIGENLLHLTL